MAFKNAFKNLVAHFGIVWSLLLFILIFAALIVGLSLPFVLPIARAFADAGVFELIREAFTSLFGEGGWQSFWDGMYEVYRAVVGVFESNTKVASLTMLFIILILIVVFRFVLGLYEIPLATVLDGRLSCDARYGLGGKFFSTLPQSALYSLTKLVYTVLFDGLIFGINFGLGKAIGMNMGLPLVLIFVTLLLTSLRFSICACWAPSVASGERGIIKGFFYSAKICFRRFGSMYSTYFVAFLIILSVGLFLTLFTLGVGLLFVLPFAACFISYINATEYYIKTGKRYYVDGGIITPPIENVL